MEITQHHLYKTELKDRILWADGTSSFEPAKLIEYVVAHQSSKGVYTTEINKHIEQYNKIVDKDEQVTVKQEITLDPIHIVLPYQYADMSVKQYVEDQFKEHAIKKVWSDQELVIRYKRVKTELDLYNTLGLLDVLRTIIYVINTLSSKGIVWGVGRGSSVSSYVLYLIGVHDVDSYKYELDIEDFL